MNVSEFDALFCEFAPEHRARVQANPLTKRGKKPRRRSVGCGRQYRHDLCDRLLMALVWLRIYTTYEVMGFFFGLNKTNIEDNLKEVLATLDTMSRVRPVRPPADRPKLRSPEAVIAAFPDVRLILDAKEQRIQRPKSDKENNQQKPYYSGKKKAHTLKNQVAIRPDGLIEEVSESVPGGANHDLTLLRKSGLIDTLGEGEAAMMDKGYDGICKDYPNARLYLPHKARRNRPLTDPQKEDNRLLAGCRIVIEHAMAQLNRFSVLSQVWRHARARHSQVVRVVAGLVNRRTHACPLKRYSDAPATA